ncbi:hypothetical protein D9757_008362 [Collybiopsis confluens]|uniref:Uncharacterized protein n=1 Tax=Collybiopsis confluens TaxID=2823264 RepID=A0A8H5HEF8_9AGAR|nr:hypothetical protein D9757_008362 [Collybiopsis confluens]
MTHSLFLCIAHWDQIEADSSSFSTSGLHTKIKTTTEPQSEAPQPPFVYVGIKLPKTSVWSTPDRDEP